MPPQKPQQPDNQAFDMAQKRAMAQLAMEGAERRRKREEEEKFRQEKELLEQRRQAEKLRAQSEAGKLEAERLEKIKQLREERLARGAEEKKVTEEVREEKDVSLSPLRTLKFDMNKMIKDTNQSMVSIAIKEDEKKRILETGVIEEKKKNHLLIIFSAILLIAGAGALGWWGYAAYQAKQAATVPNAAPHVDSIIFTEEKYEDVVVNDENAITMAQKLKNAVSSNNIKIGNMKYYRFVDNASGELRVISAAEWLLKMNSSAPDSLVRLLDTDFMYGIFSGAQNSGFLILKTSYYEKAFAGMLTWEDFLVRDLYSVTTGGTATKELQNARFTDVNIKNIDARILKNPDGTPAMVYAFLPDKKTIVIAHNEATILEVLTRLTTPKPQVVK